MFRLRSQQELDALLDEVSALGGRKTVESFYREATKKTCSFLYIRLDQSEPQFLERFDFVLEPYWSVNQKSRSAMVPTPSEAVLISMLVLVRAPPQIDPKVFSRQYCGTY